MNTHDIDMGLPPLPEDLIAQAMTGSEVRALLKRYGERCIEADRKRHDRMLAHEWIRPALGLDEGAPYRFDYYAKEIERLRADRKRSGEPVATVTNGTEWGPGLAFLANGKPRPKPGTLLYAAPQPKEPT